MFFWRQEVAEILVFLQIRLFEIDLFLFILKSSMKITFLITTNVFN